VRCQNCDYLLWTVKARACPECGTHFRPSEFEFPPNAVRFECPHCSTGYYGTSEKGHLVPSAFECVGCHRPVTMDEMVLLPGEGQNIDSELLLPNIWTSREQQVEWRFLKTVGQILVKPTVFAKSMRREAPTGPAWVFAAIAWAITAIASAALAVLALWALPAAAFAWQPPLTLVTVGEELASAAAGFVGAAIAVLIFALIQHLVAMMLAPRRASLSGTIRVGLYASGAVSMLTIPAATDWAACVFTPLAAIWWLVVTTVLTRYVHRTTPLRAFVITATPVGALFAVCGGWIAFVFFWLMPGFLAGGPGGGGFMMPPNATPIVSPVADEIAMSTAGTGYTVLDAAVNEEIEWVTLRDLITERGTRRVTIGGLDVSAIAGGDEESRVALEALAAAARAKLPDGSGPYRIGSLIVYDRIDGEDYSTIDWRAIWRESPGVYLTATAFGVYRTDAAGIRFQRKTMAQMAAGGTAIDPNAVVDLADATDAFLPPEPNDPTGDPAPAAEE
jgi:hypothetical protein